jgi:hypothetical protein
MGNGTSENVSLMKSIYVGGKAQFTVAAYASIMRNMFLTRCWRSCPFITTGWNPFKLKKIIPLWSSPRL